jgi:hypothetical protein
MSALINVFEHGDEIREGGWLKLVREMDPMPDLYGIAWYLPNQCVAVCAPMPWHTILGWAHRTYWNFRGRSNIGKSALERAYQAGVDAERISATRHAAFVRAQHEQELALAERRGAQHVIADMRVAFGLRDDAPRH